MPLIDAIAHQIVAQWSGAASAPFANDEAEALALALVALSDAVTVTVIEDVPLTAAQVQSILSARAIDYLDDWVAIAALGLRRQFETTAVWRKTDTPALPVGLRSATLQEKIDLPVVGTQLAKRLSEFFATNADVTFEDLKQIPGIGETSIRKLQTTSYLDRPSFSFLSPTLLDLIERPGVTTLVSVFETTDAHLVFGDWLTHMRRRDQLGSATTAERLRGFVEFATGRAKAAPIVARGVLASDALARLDRAAQLESVRSMATTGQADLVVNASYVDAARAMIESASSSLCLMVFLGTDAAPIDDGVGPETLIEALEAASQNVSVRVILDQDDVDDPYLSKAINLPLLNRLKAAGIPVKFDGENVLLHSKVLVADTETVLVGSHNWTRSGLNGTHEVSVRAKSDELAQSFQARFDAMWAALPDA